MDIFEVRDQLVDDYREYTGSFVDVRDPRIRAHVQDRMAPAWRRRQARVTFTTVP
jgi:hypothetical protein